MSGNDTLRIGIIGAGGIVRERHMPGLTDIEGVEVVAVCNRRSASARQFAEEFSIPRVCYHWEEIVAMDDVDVVWIGTTPYMHCPVTLAALKAGKHVFCQARMCMNLDEARRIAEAARQHPDRMLRFCPPPMGMGADRTMRRLLDEQFAGQVRQVTLASVSGHLLDPELEMHWRLQKEQSGQNVLTAGIYFEVLNRWLGPTRRVTAVTRTWTPTRIHPETRKPTPCEIPESVNVVAELASGAVGLYQFNGVSSHGPTDHLAVHGTGGTIVYDFNSDPGTEQIEAARTGDERMSPVPITDAERGRWAVEAEFIRAVRTGTCDPILPDADAALRYMAVLDAVHRSASTGRTVEVALQ